MFRRLRQVSARDGRNPRMNRHLDEVDNGRHAREERRRSGPRGAIKKVLPEHFLSEEAVGRRFTAGVLRRGRNKALLQEVGRVKAGRRVVVRTKQLSAVDAYLTTIGQPAAPRRNRR